MRIIGDIIAWVAGLTVISFAAWFFSLAFGWTAVTVVIGLLLVICVWMEYFDTSTPYRAPDEEITIIDKDGNAKTYRKK